MEGRLLKREAGRGYQFSHFDNNPFAGSSELKVKGPRTILCLLLFLFFFFKFVTFHPKTKCCPTTFANNEQQESQCLHIVHRCARRTGPLTEHVVCFCFFLNRIIINNNNYDNNVHCNHFKTNAETNLIMTLKN